MRVARLMLRLTTQAEVPIRSSRTVIPRRLRAGVHPAVNHGATGDGKHPRVDRDPRADQPRALDHDASWFPSVFGACGGVVRVEGHFWNGTMIGNALDARLVRLYSDNE